MQKEKHKTIIHRSKLFNFDLWFYLLPFTFYLLNLIGCTTSPYISYPPIERMPSLYHRVEKGQTLWRIAKTYDVDLEELVRINHIHDSTKIQPGQLIFIPHTKNTSVTLSSNQTSLSTDEDFIWPIKGKVISKFGQKTGNTINKGIDIQASYGSDVFASRSGIVSFYNEQLKGLGKTIIIDHGDNLLTVYARNSEVSVKVGDGVTQGKIIAKVGNAGRDRTNFLHFEIRKGHIPQNPYYYLP